MTHISCKEFSLRFHCDRRQPSLLPQKRRLWGCSVRGARCDSTLSRDFICQASYTVINPHSWLGVYLIADCHNFNSQSLHSLAQLAEIERPLEEEAIAAPQSITERRDNCP